MDFLIEILGLTIFHVNTMKTIGPISTLNELTLEVLKIKMTIMLGYKNDW